ncbi:MAG: TIGR04255 family protein [Candidatus Nanopelagicales bacterium]
MRAVPTREVYPNAPLVLVVAEIRHPVADVLGSRELQQQLKRSLADQFPVARPLHRPPGTMVDLGPGLPPQFQQMPATTSPRFMSRDLTTSATFNADSVVVETTEYGGFERFLSLIGQALAARLDVGPLDGVERIGLRYIDEIRVPSVSDSSEWRDWIHPGLLGPSHLAGPLELRNDAWQAISSYSGDLGLGGDFDRMAMVLRYGVGEGYATAQGDLRRRTPPPGPFFLIDIDSYWGPANSGVPTMDLATVSRALEALHAPVRVLFENSITDRLRDEVLRRDGR